MIDYMIPSVIKRGSLCSSRHPVVFRGRGIEGLTLSVVNQIFRFFSHGPAQLAAGIFIAFPVSFKYGPKHRVAGVETGL